jgi:hypothetical protein
MKLVTDGLQFPEGPVAMSDGSIVLVEVRRGTLTRVLPDGRHEIIARLGGGPNGAAIGPDGAMYVCNNGGAWEWQPGEPHLPGGPVPEYLGGSIQRVDLGTGNFTTLYDVCDGKPLNSPNDIVFDSTGGFWFTTLGYFDGENRRLGAVYHARPDGMSIVRWRNGASGLISPNGVGLSPDGRRLYVADCMIGRLYEFDVPVPGVMARIPMARQPGRRGRRPYLRGDDLERWRDGLRARGRERAPPFPRSRDDQHLLWRCRHARRMGHLREHRPALQNALAASGAEARLQSLAAEIRARSRLACSRARRRSRRASRRPISRARPQTASGF